MATQRKTQTKKTTSAAEAPGAQARAKSGGAKRPPRDAQERAKPRVIVKKKAKTQPKSATAEGRAVAPVKPAAKSVPATRERKKAEAPKAPPRMPQIDPDFQRQIREALVHQREQLLSVVRSTQAQMAEKTKNLPDVSDQASEGYGDELAVGLMAIEAAQLEDIEAAISRIDHGTYGLCVDCEKPIPRKRLEVLPFARRCLACEGQREHRIRAQASRSEEEDEH